MPELQLPVAIGPLAIFRQGPEDLLIKWLDGHHAVFPFDYLRKSCPCAGCGNKHGHEAPKEAESGGCGSEGCGDGGCGSHQQGVLVQGASGPSDIVSLAAIGRYAVSFTFGDGHGTGIYSFEYLREICPCEACASSRQAG